MTKAKRPNLKNIYIYFFLNENILIINRKYKYSNIYNNINNNIKKLKLIKMTEVHKITIFFLQILRWKYTNNRL